MLLAAGIHVLILALIRVGPPHGLAMPRARAEQLHGARATGERLNVPHSTRRDLTDDHDPYKSGRGPSKRKDGLRPGGGPTSHHGVTRDVHLSALSDCICPIQPR